MESCGDRHSLITITRDIVRMVLVFLCVLAPFA